ncbi:cell division protein ZapA [Sandarakinorhabdus sp.]|jgi:cell division protein ZapA|uniref:cell division protein ZapA n=1 Tax=Sandarakinorhabdus sp. TaxID=1916663 RepID=UPI0033410165
MAQVAITVGGHQYRIAARDGDEPRVERLGAELAARAARLTKALGVMSEAQTLVMVALMLADELADARNGATPAPDLARLARIVEQLEALSQA